MVNKKLYKLLNQYVSNSISEEDKELLKSMTALMEDEDLSPYIDLLWNEFVPEDTAGARLAVGDIKHVIDEKYLPKSDNDTEGGKKYGDRIRSFYHRPFVRNLVAAVIIGIISIPLFYMFTDTEEEGITRNIPFLTTRSNPSKDITIITNNSDTLELKENNAELVYDNSGNVILNNKNLQINADTVPSELYVPYGKMATLTLSDGTKIWANSGTYLVYPTVFTGKTRDVYLDGEIYLEVAKNEEMPFVVRTNKIDVNVLGTSFNISAYKGDDEETVVLASGSVAVNKNSSRKPVIIKPNQKFTYKKESANHIIEEVDVFENICWRYGFFVLKNESIGNVLRKIERHYNVQIEYTPSRLPIMISGKLDLKDDIEETFKSLQIVAPIEYRLDTNQNKIYVKRLKQ